MLRKPPKSFVPYGCGCGPLLGIGSASGRPDWPQAGAAKSASMTAQTTAPPARRRIVAGNIGARVCSVRQFPVALARLLG